MSSFTETVKKAFSGSLKSLKDFPATIFFAIAFALVTLIRIQIDWPQQESYSFLLNCLSWSLALGTIFSLMAITLAQSRFNTKRAFLLANIISLLALVFTFLLLYLFSGSDLALAERGYEVLSPLAIARVSVAMLICYLFFIIFSGQPGTAAEKAAGIFSIDFAQALFIHQKAFFIALIYGVVMIIGTSGVAGAIQALLYPEMSFKVYQFIATIAGFIAFTMFVAYFPDFRKGTKDAHREAAQDQPRFVEILFEYIMIPMMTVLSIVLLIWTGRTVFSGIDVPFVQLAGIAAAYTIAGNWLHMMVSEYKSKLANFYLRFYPLAAILILVPYAIALWNQLKLSGLKLTEYWFILVWLVAASGAVLILIRRSRAYIYIVAIICVLAVFSVLPISGYNVLPVKAQTARLEALLTGEDMFKEDTIIPTESEPDPEVRAAITDAVVYLAFASDASLPAWFDRDYQEDSTFRSVFGFNKTWLTQPEMPPEVNKGISLYLPDIPIDISDYSLAIKVMPSYEREQPFLVDGERGTYRIDWPDYGMTVPVLEIQLEDEVILRQDMRDYVDALLNKYPNTNLIRTPAELADMTMVLKSTELDILLVFRNVGVIFDSQNAIYYELDLDTIYMQEK